MRAGVRVEKPSPSPGTGPSWGGVVNVVRMSGNSGSSKLHRAQVVYYLARAGNLEQPHLIDVSYSDRHGLLLKDVKQRLVAIRGRGMPELFSWSYKTRYKNEFIWHDVSDNDAILPVSDTEYVLKGSEIVDGRESGRLLLDDSDGEIQCKNMLKDHARLTKSPEVGGRAEDSAPTKPEECVIGEADASAARNISEAVKIYKRRPNSEHHGSDATTQTDGEEEAGAAGLRIKLEKENRAASPALDSLCRGEKPLPSSNPPQPCPVQIKRDQAPEFKINKAGCSSGSPAKSDNARKQAGIDRSSLIFRQMLPCADVSTKIHHRQLHQQQQQGSAIFGSGNNKNGYGGQQTKLDFSSWKQQSAPNKSSSSSSSWRSRGAKLVNLDLYRNRTKVSSAAARDVDARRSYELSHSLLRGTPGREPTQQKQGYSTLTRYRPRHSFSNSDYFDAYDLYLQPAKVSTASELLEWSMSNKNNNQNPTTRQSNASRLSPESLYEVDCNKCSLEQQQNHHNHAAQQQPMPSSRSDLLDSPRASVSSHIISKLVLEAKAKAKASEDKDSAKVAWWDEIRTPRRSEERFRKNKLDWEKNLQDAVNMIIRPGAQDHRKTHQQQQQQQ